MVTKSGTQTRFVVRCPDWETEYKTRRTAETSAARTNQEPFCPHTNHTVVEQARGPETNWQWKDVAAS